MNHDLTDPFESEGDVATATRPRPEPPALYRVVFYNDNETPMGFVVDILMRLFAKTQKEALAIMLQVHVDGAGVAGIYSREVAETKTMQATAEARRNNFPLRVEYEPE